MKPPPISAEAYCKILLFLGGFARVCVGGFARARLLILKLFLKFKKRF